MTVELRKYQKDALEFILKRAKSGLFLPTGMGKTLIALLYLKILDKPAVVICPASIRHVWIDENKKFKLGVDITSDYRNPGKVLLVSYDWVKYNSEVLNDYDIVVLDEAHCISDTTTVRYQNLSEILKEKSRVVLLSGYPVENRLAEIFVVSLISDVLGKSYYHFLHKFFHVIRRNNRIIKAVPKSGSVTTIINLIKDIVYVADKAEAFDKPVKKENLVVRYKLSDYQNRMIDELANTGEYRDEKLTIRCKNELVVFQKLLQIISGFVYLTDDFMELHPVYFSENPKLKVLTEVIKNKSNYLLWYFFDSEKSMLEQFAGSCRLSKIQTDSRGLNLQHYKFSVYYSIPMSGGMMLQSQDRLYRIGRKTDVLSVIILPEGPIGDRLLKMTDNKFKLTSRFIRDLLRCRGDV